MKQLLRLLRQDKGFTLMELMVVIGLLSVLIGTAYFFLNHTVMQTQRTYNQTDVEANIRIAADRMTREIRQATTIYLVDNSTIEFLLPNGKEIKYYYDSRTNEIRRLVDGEGYNPITDQIKSVKFARMETDGNKPNYNTIVIEVEGAVITTDHKGQKKYDHIQKLQTKVTPKLMRK